MEGSDWAAVIVGLISVIAAIFSGKAARSAAKLNADASTTNSRTLAETEAYARARKMDIETIERQEEDIEELRKNNHQIREKLRALMEHNERLRNDNQSLHQDNEVLRRRVSRLEVQLGDHHEQ
jgi:predicted RNase H-like nuclease (RuvC/YqgF family)